MLHSMAQEGVEVVSANKPMIMQEGKRCWLSASVTSVLSPGKNKVRATEPILSSRF